MKTTIFTLLASLFLLSSCSSYQYLKVSSDNISSRTDNQDLVSENDSVRITYNFNGYKGPVTITVLNKSERGLEIDWKKSSLIVGDKSEAYYKPEWQINGHSGSILFTNATSTTINATVTREEGTEFLPPHTAVTRSAHYIKPNGSFGMPANAVEEKVKIEGISKKLKKGTYTKENSPLIFRSYLTFKSVSDNQSFAIDHSFYVSEIMETVLSPDLIWSSGQKEGDSFYIKHDKD